MRVDWKNCSLSSVLNIKGGGTPKTSNDDYWNGSIPWLSVVDFNNDYRRVGSSEKSITELGLRNSSANILEKGQIIISARGTVGQLAQLSVPMAFNQSCYGLDGKSDLLENDFGYYLLKYSIDKIKSNSHGSVFDTITRATFDNLEVSIPPLPEQRAIASILSNLDDKIENNLAMNKTLEEMAMALYKHWFVDFGPFQDGKFVDSELGMIPEGWEVKEIGNIYSTTSGGTPSRKKSEYFGGTIPWVKSKELYGNFVVSTEEKITELGLSKSSAKLLKKGDVLLAMYGATVGECSILTMEAACNQAICALKKKSLSTIYVYHYLKYFKEEILNQAVGSAQQNISQKIIKSLKIIVPDIGIPVLKKIEDLYEIIEHNLKENQTLKEQRDTLLPKLVSGEVRVKGFG